MLMICSTKYRGCGHIGPSSLEFDGDGDNALCLTCGSVGAIRGLTNDNLAGLTDETNRKLGKYLLDRYTSKTADYELADCDCTMHAETGNACPHDLILARDKFKSTVVAA